MKKKITCSCCKLDGNCKEQEEQGTTKGCQALREEYD